MSPVGISFGSPTAGTGFDVSSTVSQIVANLKNVESPWQQQLSASEAQDAAISNLGSLLSALSNDVSNLSDFSGVLATMDGSSSDPNVVALTSASSAAIPGTHTIVVNSLASTASGYLTAITNTSDALSGSISIQVGTAAAQTVNVTAGSTLSDVASAINNAGIGVTASVLTDASGSRLSLVSGTSGANGSLTVSSAVTDTTTGTALGYTSASPGANSDLIVDGVEVHTASNTVSTVIPGVTFQLLAPSPVTGTTAETVQVQIVNDTSTVTSALQTFASDYNAVISAINAQEQNNSSGVPQPLFGTPTLSLLQEQLLGSINQTSTSGYTTAITSSTDTLSGTISIAVGSGTATTFDVSTLSSGDQTLAGLAAAINAANLGVTASVINNGNGYSLGVSSEYGGLPTVVSSLTDATTGSSLTYSSLGDINSLSKLGFAVQNDGSISLDTAQLGSELNSDYSGVLDFFQGANSWGLDFSTALSNLGTSSTTGLLSLALNANSATESSLQTNISREDLLISTEQISLTLELTSANEILQAIPSQLNEVNQLYAAITGYNEKQS
ncbi:MAG TPA: flagellar filament capping protein FliD [Acidobacteriaceae bacterium]|nr:flagellar filament capping protein FliD [Acidobacteriaceae bacterium]